MERIRKNLVFAVFAGFLVCMAPLAANAAMETKTGTITGLACATVGYTCPIDEADPMIAMERDFVLLKDDGDWYIMPNLDRGVKARHALKKVQVKGFVDERYRSINVEELIVDGRVVWTMQAQREMQERLDRMERERQREFEKMRRAP